MLRSYDEMGLQLFDEITHLDEYYLTNAERKILQHHADELANIVNAVLKAYNDKQGVVEKFYFE